MTKPRSPIVSAGLSAGLALLVAGGCVSEHYPVGVGSDAAVSTPTTPGPVAPSPSTPDAATTSTPNISADAAAPVDPGKVDAAPSRGQASDRFSGVPACPLAPAAMPVRDVKISPEQVADRLARFLWATRADPSLVTRAANVRTTGDVATLARWMLASPDGATGVGAFMRRWLSLDEILKASTDPKEAGAFLDTSTRTLLARESERIATDIVLGGGTFASLLTDSVAFRDPALQRLWSDSGNRRGVFELPGWQFAYPRATRRGAFLRERLFCEVLPPPPPSIDIPTPPPSTKLVTYRQRLEASLSEPACSGCHKLTDGQGFAFEHFDTLGRYRTQDNGAPVDAKGTFIASTSNSNFDFVGGQEFQRRAAARCDAQACFVRWAFEHALGGRLRPGEERSVAEVASAFLAGRTEVKELLVAITQSEAFLSP